MKKTIYAIFYMILAVALGASVIAAPSFTANDLEFGSDNQALGVDVSQTLTLTNTGDQTLTLTLSSGLPSQYNVRFSQSSLTLAQGASSTVTVTVFIPTSQSSGRNEVLSGITVNSNVSGLSDNVRTFITTEKMLEITKVTIEIDGDENTVDNNENYDSKDLKPGVSGTLTVYVRNNFDINMDIEDIGVDVDSSGDLDLSESDDLGDLSDGDKDTISFEFDIPTDAEDGDDYDIDVDVEGEDEDGVTHKDTYTFTIEITEESYEVSITNIKLSPQTLTCGVTKSTMTVEVENTGKRDADNVQLIIKSDSLDIEEGFSLGDLETDDSARKSFTFDIGNKIPAGEYDFVVTTYYDVDEDSDVESTTLTVLSCTGSTSTGTSGTTTTTGTTTNTGSNTNVNTQPMPPVVVSSNSPSYGYSSFTDSGLYIVLLITGIVVMLAILIILLVKFVF